MYVIVYSSLTDGSEQRFISIFQQAFPEISHILCNTIQELSAALLTPSYEIFAIILMINDKSGLERVIDIHEMFINRRIIIILPSLTQDLINISHMLRPRYIASVDDNVGGIISVLKKIRAHQNID